MVPPPSARARLFGLMSRIEDGALIRLAFFGLLAGTVGMLTLDYLELSQSTPTPYVAPSVKPILPAVERPELDPSNPALQPQTSITTTPEILSAPMHFTLRTNGVLYLEGTIVHDSAEQLASELEERGEYIEKVVINSPGGLVDQALAMGRMIREHELPTHIDDHTLCASSCPLMLAGGIERTAGPAAAIGVHQVYVPSNDQSIRTNPAQALSDAQITTAQINRYLDEMGIDTKLWLHALETPPDRLYFLTTKERDDYALTTVQENT